MTDLGSITASPDALVVDLSAAFASQDLRRPTRFHCLWTRPFGHVFDGNGRKDRCIICKAPSRKTAASDGPNRFFLSHPSCIEAYAALILKLGHLNILDRITRG